ncbi:uncharacterized protein LOC108113937 [Drosophila eugracilis]|uniref:uncharacterized protein LOC108113937 n=1 Tax=Drosophila eugracilis TaxID=29029 RepID=UPI0007E708BA|nr:uncharacterized protein LOC108113937 [Drosophila eugracilis]
MGSSKTITDLTHYELFHILDLMMQNCEMANSKETVAPIKYADIFNFAATCKRFRRVVWDWSRLMYDRLEINLLHVNGHKKITVKFIEILKALKRATDKNKDHYMDIYIKALMENPMLKTVELSYDTKEYNAEFNRIFDEIMMGLQGRGSRVMLDPDKKPKFKEVIMDISGKFLRYNHFINGLQFFRNISKLRLKGNFNMFDLEEFCSNNPTLTSLEVNVNRFTDHGKLTQIVRHCPNLKQLKFMQSDILHNEFARDNIYVGLALLDKLQQLEIVKPEKELFLFHDTPQPMEMDVDYQPKRSKMDSEYESVVGGDSSSEKNTPILQLLRALGEKPKSKLMRLCLKFDIDDEMAEVITKIKGLRTLECGFCDPKSIRHLLDNQTLNRLTIRNNGHLVTDAIAELLRKHVKVSSFDSEMLFTAKGTLDISTRDPEMYRSVSFEPFLKFEGLKSLGLSNEMIVSMETTLHLFLELGVKIKSNACTMDLDRETRNLQILYSHDYAYDELPLPLVKNLKSFTFLCINMPTPQLFYYLVALNLNTLNEIYISTPYTLFEVDDDKYLNKSAAEALASLKFLRKISCGFQKLIYIKPLAKLEYLEDIEIFSQHRPSYVSYPKCLGPLLKSCRKLSSLAVNVPVNEITKKYLDGIQTMVLMNRDADMQEDLDMTIGLKCIPNRSVPQMCISPNLSNKQLLLISRPFELMQLTVKYIENEHCFD